MTLLLTERIIINHRTRDIPHITANETGFHKFRSEVSDYLPELITRFCAELPLAIIYPLYYNVHWTLEKILLPRRHSPNRRKPIYTVQL